MKPRFDTQKDLHKLFQNPVSGKTGLNQRKNNYCHFNTEAQKADCLVAKPHCLDCGIFDENLEGFEMRKVRRIQHKQPKVGLTLHYLTKLFIFGFVTHPQHHDFFNVYCSFVSSDMICQNSKSS